MNNLVILQELSHCEVIHPYTIPPWHPSELVQISQKAEAARKKAEAQQSLVAVIGTTCQKEILGAGGAIYTSLMPNMTENLLNSFSCTISPKATSGTFTTKLYGISYALN